MAGSDLHMVMDILSSAALAEQGRLLHIGPLLEDLRIAIRKVSSLEETPDGMIKLAGNNRLPSASARLRDILDAVLVKQLRSEPWHQVFATFSSNNPLFRFRVTRELRSLLSEFTEIATSAANPGHDSERIDTTQRNSNSDERLLFIVDCDSANENPLFFREHVATKLRNENPLVIREHMATKLTKVYKSLLAKLNVVEKMVRILLVDKADNDGPLFLPLAGGPASGKTLLAQTLFDDARVKEKFIVRVWVQVSQCFDISKILQEILNAVGSWEYMFYDQAILKRHVSKALSSRRYLIVIDDAWSENVPEWHALMEALPPNGTLILTSRISAVVSCVATIKPHPLGTMNKNLQFKFVLLWKIIRREIEGVLTKELMVQMMGKVTTEFVLQRARASYFHLSLDLRKCLLHCSVFPLGHKFNPEELADLLVAEGRISPTMTCVQRICFVQKLFDECFDPVEESENTTGKRTYWMHSIMHMFAKIVDVQPIPAPEKRWIRYQGIRNNLKERFQNLKATGLSIQPLDVMANFRYVNLSETDIIPSYVSKSLFPRTLILSHCEKLQTLHDITGMTNLRYLNLSWTSIERIPKFVSKLHFLQTLILSHCEKLQILHDATSMLGQLQKIDLEGCCYLVQLPPHMSKMKSLQFLNVHECSSLTGMPSGMGQLMNLETMLGYIVPNNDGRAISELQTLANLKMLSLESLENISNVADAGDAKLQEKQELESLALKWNNSADNSNASVSEVLECLRPNQHLKTLEIVGYEGNVLPYWMKSSDPYLISLVAIRLVTLKNCETLPPLGLLPLLKTVEISGAETISSISDSFYGSSGTFPSLEKLTLSYMSNLELWEQPHNGPVFPCLAEVMIIQCPKLALRVELPSITKLILWMNNKMLYSSEGAFGNMAQNLKHVSISFCQELIPSSDCVGLQDLCSIKVLELCGCDEMTYLPHSLQHISTLRSLTIGCCNKLETLPDWLGNISSLYLLYLYACPMLYSIPKVLRQRLYNRISIKYCPKLPAQPLETTQERYDNEDGDELFGDTISDEFVVEELFLHETQTEKFNGSKPAVTLSKDFSDSKTDTCEIAPDLYSTVMNTPGFTEEQLFYVLSHLLDNEAIGNTFMGLPELGRIPWIAKFVAKHFEP